jgi:hypothetical protein
MCSVEDYFDKLNNYFNEIIIVDENPHIINSEEIYKESGVIKRKVSTKLIELTELIVNKKTKDLISPEFYDYGLLQRIRKTKNKLSFYFFPKNIFQRLFKRRSELIDYLNSIDDNDYFLITTPDISKKLKRKVKIEIKEVNCFDELSNEVLEKQIIVFNKRSNAYIHKQIENHKEFDDLVRVYCGVDLDDFTIINLR